MVKGTTKPTWVLLSPNKLPPASEVKNILGAIVPDYENPAQNGIPQDASAVIPATWFTDPTEDGNFNVALERASGHEANIRLGDILRAAFKKNVSNDLHLSSTLVRTYTLKQEIKVFKLLKQSYKEDLLELINSAPSRFDKSIFEVVAIKTCVDAEMASQDVMDKSKDLQATLPVNTAVTAATGVPPPVNTNIQGGASSTAKSKLDESHVAKGERIFAVQYRIIKKHSDWLSFARTVKPEDPELKDMLFPTGPSMYGPGDNDTNADQELDEDEDEDEDDDPLELGDLEHIRTLATSEDDNVILTTL